jgi:hypothetical protein
MPTVVEVAGEARARGHLRGKAVLVEQGAAAVKEALASTVHLRAAMTAWTREVAALACQGYFQAHMVGAEKRE